MILPGSYITAEPWAAGGSGSGLGQLGCGTVDESHVHVEGSRKRDSAGLASKMRPSGASNIHGYSGLAWARWALVSVVHDPQNPTVGSNNSGYSTVVTG